MELAPSRISTLRGKRFQQTASTGIASDQAAPCRYGQTTPTPSWLRTFTWHSLHTVRTRPDPGAEQELSQAKPPRGRARLSTHTVRTSPCIQRREACCSLNFATYSRAAGLAADVLHVSGRPAARTSRLTATTRLVATPGSDDALTRPISISSGDRGHHLFDRAPGPVDTKGIEASTVPTLSTVLAGLLTR